MSFLFLRQGEVLELHGKLLAEFGGASGLRDEGALKSALLAAENREYYENADLAACAAAYACHLTQAHAFVDGNKRIAAVTETSIEINGSRLNLTNEELVALFLKIVGKSSDAR